MAKWATVSEATKTAAIYRLYALDTTPPKPGLIRTTESDGASIELEIWELSSTAFGTFVAAIPPPLGIGTIRLVGSNANNVFSSVASSVQ